jgi:hypothetical protein
MKLPDSDPKANVRQSGHSPTVGDHTLSGAIEELRRQHPKAHDDLGPHHEGMEHVRHIPLHGLKPSGR